MDTIISLLRQSTRRHQLKPALRHKVNGCWVEMSYREMWEISDHVAAGLIRSGARPGDHALLLAPSSPRWVCTYLGVLKAGGIVIPVDKELKSAELRHILSDCDARYLFVDGGYLDPLLEGIADPPGIDRVILLDSVPQKAEALPGTPAEVEQLVTAWKELVTAYAIPPQAAGRLESLASTVHRLLTVPATTPRRDEPDDPFSPARSLRKSLGRQGRITSWDEFLTPSVIPLTSHNAEDTAVILYTSGTTGRSKGAMLSHANIVSNIRGAIAHFNLTERIHTLSVLPINHVFEQVCGILLPLALGGTISFAESIRKLGENLAEVRPTFFLAVPAVFRMIHDRLLKNIDSRTSSRLLFSFPPTRPLIRSRIRRTFGHDIIFVSGGAPLDPDVARGINDLGLTILQGYGITETSPVIAAEAPGHPRPGTVGQPLADVSVRIENAGSDGVGEIIVKGPNVMQGYYRHAEATAEVLRDGWYRTGDLGQLESDGSLRICGRLKNLIVTPNGKNVYPEEVEQQLLTSPYIAEVMVYGHKVDATAEEVHAIIYPDQDAIDGHLARSGKGKVTMADVEELIRGEVLRTCRDIADYKKVRKFTLRDIDFPKTTTRKIKRFAVEAEISLHP